MASAVTILLFAVGSGAVSGNSSVPSKSTSTSTTVVEKLDDESGLIWSQIDDHTIEISLPD
jgi:altronate dehydratase